VLIHFVLDQLLPPIIRDSRWFLSAVFYLLFGSKAKYFLEFKDKVPYLTDEEIDEYYELLEDKFVQRPTDLNKACIRHIEGHISGSSVLDVACGRGFMSELLVKKGLNVTGVDIVIPEQTSENPNYIKGRITELPFPDNHFDTVVCTHTLEHIRDVSRAIQEIKRVCNKRLSIVVPCQREYRYTFDLHIHFFPYEYKLRELLGPEGTISKLGGDFLYTRDTS
jgi:ubiquinone/menaquinone biosynthesis C-methylase UbiE